MLRGEEKDETRVHSEEYQCVMMMASVGMSKASDSGDYEDHFVLCAC